MKRFTIDDIRSWSPCYDPSECLPKDWSGTALDILDLYEVPFDDRLWVILRTDLVSERFLWVFTICCASQAKHLMTDERSLFVLEFMEAYCEWRYLSEDPDWVAMWERERQSLAPAFASWGDRVEHAWLWLWTWAEADSARLVAGVSARRTGAYDAALTAQEAKLREMLIEGFKTGEVK